MKCNLKIVLDISEKLYTFKVTLIKIMKEYNAWETCKFDKTQTNDLIQILNVQDYDKLGC